MRRVIMLAIALLAIGCSSHSALPVPSTISPDVFQRHPLQLDWTQMATKPIHGLTANPGSLVMDGGHKMWVAVATSGGASALERIAMDQKVTATLPISFFPQSIVIGSDQNFWIIGRTPSNNNVVARVTPTGVETDYSVDSTLNVGNIVSGPDGALWFPACFNNSASGGIGRVDTSGGYTFYPGPCAWKIANPHDGNLWFVGFDTPNAYATFYAESTNGVLVGKYPTQFVEGFNSLGVGLDGTMYAPGWENTPFLIPTIVSCTTSGVVVDYGGTPDNDGLFYAVGGPDGRIYMTGLTYRNHSIIDIIDPKGGGGARIRPDGTLGSLAPGPDGNMWFSGSNSSRNPAFVATYVLQVITLSRWSMSVQVGHSANVGVSETNYSGQWTAVAKNPAIVSVTPNSQNGMLSMTGLAPGTTVVTVYDTMYNSAKVKITVQ